MQISIREPSGLPASLVREWQTSTSLEANDWEDATDDVQLTNTTDMGDGTIEMTFDYTLPTSSTKLFIRRVVTEPAE